MKEKLESEIRIVLQERPNICRKEFRQLADVIADVEDMNCDRETLKSFIDSLRPNCSDVCDTQCPYSAE